MCLDKHYGKIVKKSVGNDIKEALHKVLLLFTFPAWLFSTPFCSVVEMPDDGDGHVHRSSPVLIWDPRLASRVFFIGLVPIR